MSLRDRIWIVACALPLIGACIYCAGFELYERGFDKGYNEYDVALTQYTLIIGQAAKEARNASR